MYKRIFVSALMIIFTYTASTYAAEKTEVTLYKTPNCGCCEGYATYLRENGFKVTVKPTHNMPMMKKLAGVPENLEGCHTSMIEGYVVEGHVPVGPIKKMLNDRPSIKGISVPGMPQGSPGMTGIKIAPFTVYEINKNQQTRVYAVE